MILTITAPNGRSVEVDTEENPHTCILDDSFTCIACVAQSLVGQSDKARSELLTDDTLNELAERGSDQDKAEWRCRYSDQLTRIGLRGTVADLEAAVREEIRGHQLTIDPDAVDYRALFRYIQE